MTTLLVDFSTLDQSCEPTEYLNFAIFDVNEPSPEQYAAEIARRASQMGLEPPYQADIVALPPGTVVPDEFKGRLLSDEAARMKFGSVGRVRIVPPSIIREHLVVTKEMEDGEIEIVDDVDVNSPYGCELYARIVGDRELDEGATGAALLARFDEIGKQFEAEFGTEAFNEAAACMALLSYLNENEPGFSAREHASASRLCKHNGVVN